MKRRDLLKMGGAGLGMLSTSSMLTSCSDSGSDDPDAFWRNGNYPPVTEEITETNLKVEGAIPTDLNGYYYRNGPNNWKGPSEHFFWGDGMIHGVKLENGQAKWYRNRYVETPFLYGNSSNFKTALDPAANQSNVSLIHHGGKLLSLGEAGLPFVVDPESLATAGAHDYQGKLKGAMTAHPKVDPVTGELLFFGYYVTAPYLTYYRVNAAGELVQKEELKTAGPALMHDFAITENYVIFMELPVVFSWMSMMTGEAMPFGWDSKAASRIGVMPKTGSSKDLKWFEVDPCFSFHTMNAFEQGDEVVLDLARYERLWVKDSSDFNHPANLSRYTLNLKSGAGKLDKIANDRIEFPQINRDNWGRSYRYGYALKVGVAGTGASQHETIRGMLKYDLKTGETQTVDVSEDLIPGEMFFVPSSSGGNEDDGYVLNYVYSYSTHSTTLWIRDAHNIKNVLAKVPLQARVPQGFHGLWMPMEALNS